jgi:hypothetical protein
MFVGAIRDAVPVQRSGGLKAMKQSVRIPPAYSCRGETLWLQAQMALMRCHKRLIN